MLTRSSLQQRIERILKPFRREDVPDLMRLVSGVNEPPTDGIDDGARYDPGAREKPDFVAKDLIGWK